MYLEVHPEGPSLTPAQAKTLDDEFFRSDPGSHYSSRIAGLLRDAEAAPKLSRAEQPAFFKALGIQADELSVGKPDDRDMRVAVDALALRHHCAEALSRFVQEVARDGQIGAARLVVDAGRLLVVHGDAYAGQQWSADQTRQPFSFRQTAVGDQAMTLRTIRFDGHLDGVMTPSEDFVVQWTNKGRGTITTDTATIEMEHGRPQLWPQQGAAFSYDDYDQRIVQINKPSRRRARLIRRCARVLGVLRLVTGVEPRCAT